MGIDARSWMARGLMVMLLGGCGPAQPPTHGEQEAKIVLSPTVVADLTKALTEWAEAPEYKTDARQA